MIYLRMFTRLGFLILFFFNDTATTEIYTLSLHDALPICAPSGLDWIRLGCGGDLRGLRTDMSIVLLARDLGLSISTVSRALNGYHDVAPATKQRVLKRAREIGYRPNPGARRLKSRKSSLVRVILPAASDGVRFVDSVASG